MITEKVYVRPYILAGYCDKCGGRLKATGIVYTTYPEIYEYACVECGHRQESHAMLDTVLYEEITDDKPEEQEEGGDDEEIPFP